MGSLARLLACSLAVLGLWKAWMPRIESACVPLVLYPWLVLAGLPRRDPVSRPWRALVLELALLIPPLALAVRLDRDAGAGAELVVALAGLLLVALLSSSANLASRATLSRALHGALWFAAILVLPLACAVLGWGDRRTSLACERWSAASPLAWIHAAATSAPSASIPWSALSASVALLGLGWFMSARGPRK